MVIIIAEIGENHCGDMKIAKELIDVAADAGCDYAKFQLYDAQDTSLDDPEREWFEKVQLDQDKLSMLAEHCHKKGIKPLCAPWDKRKAEIIFRVGIEDMKIASFHIVDKELLKFVNGKAKKVFMSTGMSDFDEIKEAVKLLSGTDLYLLHCVSEYPLPYEHVNLKVMDTLRSHFGNKVKPGYSDHTIGIFAPIAAAARGAEVIEKHITLDKNMSGTDHILSADPKELKEIVNGVRQVEKMLGAPEKILTSEEKKNQQFLRQRFSYGKKDNAARI